MSQCRRRTLFFWRQRRAANLSRRSRPSRGSGLFSQDFPAYSPYVFFRFTKFQTRLLTINASPTCSAKARTSPSSSAFVPVVHSRKLVFARRPANVTICSSTVSYHLTFVVKLVKYDIGCSEHHRTIESGCPLNGMASGMDKLETLRPAGNTSYTLVFSLHGD